MDDKNKCKREVVRAIQLWECGDITRENLEYIFPELKESEDEKVKRIIHSISNKISFHLHDIFTEEEFQCFDAWSNAWLEKQVEQEKPQVYETENGEIITYSEIDGYKVVEPKDALKCVGWTEEDEKNWCGIMDEIETNKGSAPDFDIETYDKFLSWLYNIKQRIGG